MTVTRTRRWSKGEIVTKGAVRITSPMRTLLDVGARIRERELELALDTAHRQGLIELRRFASYLEEAAATKVGGASVVLHLVQVRTPGRAIESQAETLLFRTLRRAGLPLPKPQYWIRTRAGRRRVDFAYPDQRLAIEFDSVEFHGGRRALDADSARDNELADAGWDRRHITWTMLQESPADVAWTVARGLGLHPKSWHKP